MTWAKPGVKCECIDASPVKFWGVQVPFSEGEVLTVSAVWPDGCIELVEYPKDHPATPISAFNPSRFRPLVSEDEAKDIALFQEIADHSRIDQLTEELDTFSRELSAH